MSTGQGRLDRAHGALAGLALGDALGMPTQSFTRAEVVRRFGRVVPGLVDAPDDQPVAAGMRAGSVTDDTEQALLLAGHLVRRAGRPDPRAWALELLAWEERMTARGSRDLLGPSTSRAVHAIRAGADPAAAGATGTTNGAAMRIAPLGLARAWGVTPPARRAFLDAVESVCLPTHHTGVAVAGAAAVAAAVSVAVDGAGCEEVLDAAAAAAREGARRGRPVPGPSVAARLEWVRAEVAARDEDVVDDWLYDVVGTTVATSESVPAALALLPAALRDPWTTLRRAASLGGDTDTVAAVLGAVAGAVLGRRGLPAQCAVVERRNGLDLAGSAAELLALRDPGGRRP